MDPVIRDLDNHLANLDKEQEREKAIEELAILVYWDLLGGQIIAIGKDNWSLDDFLSDFEIDVCYFARFLLGDNDDHLSHAKEKLNEFAEMLATKIIDGK